MARPVILIKPGKTEVYSSVKVICKKFNYSDGVIRSHIETGKPLNEKGWCVDWLFCQGE